MAKVPPHLRIKFGLPEHTGSRKISAYWLSYCGPNHKEFISLFWAMEMEGALEQHGDPARFVERRSQARIALRLGIDRSTLNRRMQLFSDPDGRWSHERRQKFSEYQRAAAENQGKQVRPGRAMRSVKRIHRFLNKNAGFGQVQLYSLAMPQEFKPQIAKKESKTANAEALAMAFGTDWFDPARAGVNNWKSTPEWHWMLVDVEECECQLGQLCLIEGSTCPKCNGEGKVYPRDIHGNFVPLADYGSMLLQYLTLKGLVQYGTVEIKQEKIAEDLGLDVNTVAKYIWKLEMLGIIRYIPGEITWECLRCRSLFTGKCKTCGAETGTVNSRKPNKILYLPDRLLDEDISEREWKRFYALQKEVEERAFAVAADLHAKLLLEWRGKEHSLKAFWKEMRRRLASAGIKRNIMDALFPDYRE